MSDDIIRYRVLKYFATTTISTERFEKETERFYVRRDGSRVIKDGVDYVYFPTFEDARKHSLRLAEHDMRVAQRYIDDLEKMRGR